MFVRSLIIVNIWAISSELITQDRKKSMIFYDKYVGRVPPGGAIGPLGGGGASCLYEVHIYV
jgi:hypothetical protein